MPESPLVQIETSCARGPGSPDRRPGQGRNRDRDWGFAGGSIARRRSIRRPLAAACRQVQGRRAKPWRPSMGGRARRRSRLYQRDTQATQERVRPGPSSRSTISSRRSSAGPRRPRRRPAGKRWRSSRARATRGSSGGGRPRPTGRARSTSCTSGRTTRVHLLKRCGRTGRATPEEAGAAWRPRPPLPPSKHRLRNQARRPATKVPRPRPPNSPPEDNPLTHLRAGLTRIEDELIALDALKLPKFLQIQIFLWPFLLLGRRRRRRAGHSDVDRLDRCRRRGGRRGHRWRRSGPGSAWPRSPGRSVLRHAVPLRKALADAEQLVEQNKDWVKNEFETQAQGVRGAAGQQGPRGRGDDGPRRRRGSSSAQQKPTQEADVKFPARLEQIRERATRTSRRSRSTTRLASPRSRRSTKRTAASSTSRTGRPRRPPSGLRPGVADPDQELDRAAWRRIDDALREVNEEAARRFLDWTQPELDGWKPPTEVPPGLRFGDFAVDLSQFPNGVPVDPRLKSVPTHFDLPALLPFPIQGSMLIQRGRRAARTQAITLLQSLMLRYLTSDPGRARSASPSSTRSAWARTSPPSCTWATTTSSWSPTASGPSRPTSSSG